MTMLRVIIPLSLLALCSAQRGVRPAAFQQGLRPSAFEQLVPEAPAPALDPSGLDPVYATECPDSYGFYADAEQCDKYYECKNWTITEKLCSDGMGFVDYHPRVERCDFLFNVDCADRPRLQPATPTEHCPRSNGFYPHEETNMCDKFYQCSDGTANALTCPPALIFDLKTGTCTWPEQAGRTGCSAEDVLEFKCPAQTAAEARKNLHPRYADEKDCQFFFVCLNGKIPRRNGCPFAKVYDIKTESCSDPPDVPECATWYDGDPKYEDLKVKKTQIKLSPKQAAQVNQNKRRQPQIPATHAIPVNALPAGSQIIDNQVDAFQSSRPGRRPAPANSLPIAANPGQDRFQPARPGRVPINPQPVAPVQNDFEIAREPVRPAGRVPFSPQPVDQPQPRPQPVNQVQDDVQKVAPQIPRRTVVQRRPNGPFRNRPAFNSQRRQNQNQRRQPAAALPPQEERFADQPVQDVPVRRKFQSRRVIART